MVQQPPGPPPGGMQPPPMGPPQAPMRPPRPQIDTSNLPIADIVAAVSALIVVILSGIGWYGGEGYHRMGLMGTFGLIVGILVLLCAIVMIVNKYLDFMTMELPTGLIYLGAAGLIALFLIIGIFLKPSLGFAGIYEIKIGVAWAIWILTLIFNGGIGVAGFLKMG